MKLVAVPTNPSFPYLIPSPLRVGSIPDRLLAFFRSTWPAQFILLDSNPLFKNPQDSLPVCVHLLCRTYRVCSTLTTVTDSPRSRSTSKMTASAKAARLLIRFSPRCSMCLGLITPTLLSVTLYLSDEHLTYVYDFHTAPEYVLSSRWQLSCGG
jgi:hypothetical protein